MSQSPLLRFIEERAIIHIGGASGSGKTLLVAELAALESRTGSIDWICADAKESFIGYLKKAVRLNEGNEKNLTLTIADNYCEVLSSIRSTRDRLREDTNLIVVDPITRVLDMSRNNEVMWGRNLFEESLPFLVGLCIQRNLSLIITSEMRFRGDQVTPVFWEKLRSWVDIDIMVKRIPDSAISEVYDTTSKDEEKLLMCFTYKEAGLLQPEPNENRRSNLNCSEEQSIA